MGRETYQQHYYNLKVTVSEIPLNSHFLHIGVACLRPLVYMFSIKLCPSVFPLLSSSRAFAYAWGS